MDILLLIALIITVLALLTNAFRPMPQPQIIYVQAEIPERHRKGLGCLLWIVGAFLLLVMLGIFRIGG
jgi:hypothetical protein